VEVVPLSCGVAIANIKIICACSPLIVSDGHKTGSQRLEVLGGKMYMENLSEVLIYLCNCAFIVSLTTLSAFLCT
jgi:hypothetical protein